MKAILQTALFALIGACGVAAQEPGTEKREQPAFKFVLTDCLSFQDNKLTVKFRLDDNFKSYASARFTYPRQAALRNAKVGEMYALTFNDIEAAHNVKAAQLIEGEPSPEKVPDNSLIAKIVDANDKSVVVEWSVEKNTTKFFAREHTFPIRNGKQFVKGQTIKIVFEKDNRHCHGYLVVDEKSKK